MWTIKRFKSVDAQRQWIDRNSGRYQITVLFVNNGWAVEFRPLRRVY